MVAAAGGYLPTCVLLTDSGADVDLTDIWGRTALSLAAEEGHHDVVDHLIKQQANINTTDDDGESPLIIPAREEHLQVCVLLTDSGADVHLADRYCNLRMRKEFTDLIFY